MVINSESDIGIGFSDRILLGVSIVGFTALVYVVHSLLSGLRSSSNNIDGDDTDGALTEEERLIRCADVNTLNRTQRRARAKAIMKERRRVQNPSLNVVADNNMEHENGDEANIVQDGAQLPTHRVPPAPILSRKERQQNAKITEKEERRLLQDERERQQKLVQLEAQRQKKERMIAATQRLLEEEQQKAVEEAVREEKEHDLWYNFISTLSSDATTPVKKKTVSEFVEECQKDRVVDIQKIARQYNLEPHYIVDRLQQLISHGRIAGFFRSMNDEPHQFIYISDDELHSIASTTRSRGCVSLQQFTTICQQIIEK